MNGFVFLSESVDEGGDISVSLLGCSPFYLQLFVRVE